MALERRVRRGAPARALFGAGYLFGFTFFLVGTHWIALLSDVAMTVPWLKYPAWVAAAAYLALYPALACGLAGVLARRARVGLAWTFPPVFLAVEELRASGDMGFPWFQPGYSQHAYVPLIQLASLGGVTLVTLWVLALNVLAWRALAGEGRLRAALGAILLVAAPWAWGQRVLDATPQRPGPEIALVQGNVAGEIKWSGRHQPEILTTFLALSRQVAGHRPPPALIVWPETATGSYLRKQVEQVLPVTAFAAASGVPLFSGFADYQVDSTGVVRHYNAAGTFLPDGRLGPVYAKRHLVPFGERMPFESLFPALGRIELGQAEWTPGRSTVLFPSAAGPFSCLVCFEAIFPDLARTDVRAGARWLVNVTNDEWFGNSSALYQHAAMAVFRAVENHVPLARCANTGLTTMVDANGRVVAQLPVFRPAVLAAPLPPAIPFGFPTPWTRFGDWPGALAGLAVAGLALAALTGRGRGAAPR